jgi:glutathione S-transferase
MLTARISPAVELARWLFERQDLPYQEAAHVLMLHGPAGPAGQAAASLPVVTTPTRATWRGAREVLDGIDAAGPAGRRLFGEDEAERTANRALLDRLLPGLLTSVPRFVYGPILPLKGAMLPTVIHRAPGWERAFASGLYPLWRGMAAAGLGCSPEARAQAASEVEAMLALVEAELAHRATPFLGGVSPGVLDIAFAALAGPLVLPRNYGARLPPLEELPDDSRAAVAATRARPAGQLIQRTYDAARAYR